MQSGENHDSSSTVIDISNEEEVSQEVNHDLFFQNLLQFAVSGELSTEEEEDKEAYRNAFGANLEFAGDFVCKLTFKLLQRPETHPFRVHR
jgi:hypothetical protein